MNNLRRRWRRLCNLDMVPVADVKSAVDQRRYFVAATNTNVPVFSGEWLGAGGHISSIVGSNVGMVQSGVIAQKRRELDDATLTRAAAIGIASRQLAIQDQQGDIYDQVASRATQLVRIAELREIVGGQETGRLSTARSPYLKTTAARASLN